MNLELRILPCARAHGYKRITATRFLHNFIQFFMQIIKSNLYICIKIIFKNKFRVNRNFDFAQRPLYKTARTGQNLHEIKIFSQKTASIKHFLLPLQKIR